MKRSKQEASPDFGPHVIATAPFLRQWHALPAAIQRLVKAKVAVLLVNPSHPSLRAHRLNWNRAISICSIGIHHRLLYQRKNTTLWLFAVGTHAVVDRAHLHF